MCLAGFMIVKTAIQTDIYLLPASHDGHPGRPPASAWL
jgi:hypothetical protein